MSRELSLKYLMAFLEFCKINLNYSPVVLGGWAVYALTQKEMSVDIDILLKSKEDIKNIELFFKNNNFKLEKDRLGNITFEKDLETPLEIDEIKIENIIFDIIIQSEPNKLHENKSYNISWSLCFDYNKEIEYNGVKLLIPLPELLLIYKVKAYRDRIYDKYSMYDHFAGKKIWHKRKDFKINKDKRDIQSIVKNVTLNPELLDKLLLKTKFKDYFNMSIDELIK